MLLFDLLQEKTDLHISPFLLWKQKHRVQMGHTFQSCMITSSQMFVTNLITSQGLLLHLLKAYSSFTGQLVASVVPTLVEQHCGWTGRMWMLRERIMPHVPLLQTVWPYCIFKKEICYKLFYTVVQQLRAAMQHSENSLHSQEDLFFPREHTE